MSWVQFPQCGSLLPRPRRWDFPNLAKTVLLGVFILGALSLLQGEGLEATRPVDSGPSTSKLTRASATAADDDVISPDDLLDVHVFDVPEISRTYRVRPNGSIELPLLPKPIAAAGLTTGQLSRSIHDDLQTRGLVSNPQVTVEIKESRIHSIAVTGAVKKAQIFPLFGRTTLLDVLSQAEGLAEDAGNTATITRGETALRALALESEQVEGRRLPPPKTVTVDLKKLMETNDPSWNLELYSGDRVTVQRAGLIYVVGAVNRPGGFTLKNDREEMTVLKALALAEDLKATAIRSKALIIRRKPEPSGQREEVPINLNDILAGRAPDVRLEANDILLVADSKSQKAIRRAAEAAIQVTTGIIVWRR